MEGFLGGDNVRVALYARVSTEEQREGQTIDSQVAELERFAREHGCTIVGVYRDDGWSGSVLARPALDQLRDHASRGLFHAVLVNDVDRLARDVTHLGIVKRDLERNALRVIFRKLPGANSPTYNLLVNVLGSFAEFERELIADRTRRGRRHKVEARKEFLGSIPAYGLRYIRKDRATGKGGRLEVDPAEAAVVRQMYAWVDEEGLSAKEVVRRLNQRRLLPRKGGARWAKSSVLRILRCETYTGLWHYNKHEACAPKNPKTTAGYRRSAKTSHRIRARSEWVPLVLPEALWLVPRDRWERVQRQLDRNRAFSPRNSRHFYLLRGLVRCGECGARYVGQPCHGRFYYRCHARCRKLPTIKEETLDQTVWGALEEAVLNPDVIAEGVARVEGSRLKTASEVQQEAAGLAQALEQAQAEEARVLEAYRLGILSPAQLARELDGLKRRRAAVEDRQAGLSAQVQRFDTGAVRRSITEYCRIAADRLKTLTAAGRQRFLRLLVQEIVFEGSRIRIKGLIPVLRLDGRDSRAACAERPSSGHAGDIATGSIGRNALNVPTTNPAALDGLGVDDSAFSVPFELTRSIRRLPHSRPFQPATRAA